MGKCFNCKKNTVKKMHSFFVCDSCKSKLRLFTDATIRKYNSKSPEKFSKEIQKRLDDLEKGYIGKRIKLLHVQEQLKNI